jgi:hypothetical protein
MGFLMDRVPNRRMTRVAFALLAGFYLPGAGLVARAAPAVATEKSKPAGLQETLRSAVAAARSKLGTLQPWQQLLFTGEVLPQAESFVREYRPQGASYKVEVDEAMLRNYLAFFAPSLLGTEQPLFLFRVEAQPGCTPCAEAVPSLRRLLESRMAGRGARLSWVKDGELPSTSSLPKPATEFPLLAVMQAQVSGRGAQGVVVLRSERASQRDDESGLELHPEDKKFRLVFGFSAGKITEVRSLEFQATDSTELSSRRLVLEAMGGVGAKVREELARDASKSGGKVDPEALLRVSGVQDYFLLSQLKSQAQLVLGELNPVQERRLAKGRCVLVIRTKLAGSELKKRLNGMQLGASKLVVKDVLEGEAVTELEAEIQ